MEKLQKRKEIRLKDFDYSTSGYYYVTICTKNRQSIFWLSPFVGADNIRPELSEYGKIVEMAINGIETYYTNVAVDKYVIMTDHIHMILKFSENNESGRIISAPTLMTVVGQMKRWVSKQIGFSVWQKSFYEHVIRDEIDYENKAEYIENNPLKYTLTS